MTIILPSNAYKDFNVEPYLAPTLPADPIRNDMIEEQKKRWPIWKVNLPG